MICLKLFLYSKIIDRSGLKERISTYGGDFIKMKLEKDMILFLLQMY